MRSNEPARRASMTQPAAMEPPVTAPRPLLALALLTLTGCHARYKKMAPRIGGVRPAVSVQGAPSLRLGQAAVPEAGSGSLAEDVVDVAVAVGTLAQAPKANGVLRRAVSPEAVAQALEASLLDSPLASALPHTIGPDGKHVMQVTVTDYGVDVSSGVPTFFTSVSVRIDRKRDGERVYRASTTCSEPLTDMHTVPLATVQKFQSLQGLGEVAALEPEELAAVAMVGVERCGQQVVERMIRHAN